MSGDARRLTRLRRDVRRAMARVVGCRPRELSRWRYWSCPPYVALSTGTWWVLGRCGLDAVLQALRSYDMSASFAALGRGRRP